MAWYMLSKERELRLTLWKGWNDMLIGMDYNLERWHEVWFYEKLSFNNFWNDFEIKDKHAIGGIISIWEACNYS